MATTERKYLSLDKLQKYHGKLVTLIDNKDAAILKSAKDYTESYVESVSGNFDTAGAAAAVQGKLDEEVARATAAEATALKAGQDAQGAVDALAQVVEGKAAQTALDALDARVGTLPTSATATNVVAYVDEKTAGIATNENLEALTGRVVQAEKDIDAIEADYLKGADKTELQGKIDAKADQTALDGVSAVANAAATKDALQGEVDRAKAEEERIVGLVEAEAERATGVEEDFEARIAAMETFWDATEDADEVVNKLKEIQDYIASDETGAATMAGNIKTNADAIEAMDKAYKAADEALQGAVDGLEEAVAAKAAQADLEKLDGRVEDVEGAVATKVEQEAYNTKVGELEAADEALDGRIAELEAKFGGEDGSVEDMIEEAKAELQGEIAAGVADAKTDAANKDAVVLAEAQKGITAVQTTLDAHTGNADIHVTTEDKAKWNTALQAADITVGSANGTIAVKGSDVAVKGLGSAAYVATTAFDASGSAAQALTDAKSYADGLFATMIEISEQDINDLFV